MKRMLEKIRESNLIFYVLCFFAPIGMYVAVHFAYENYQKYLAPQKKLEANTKLVFHLTGMNEASTLGQNRSAMFL